MSTIASMIDSKQAQAMKALVAETDPNQTAIHNHDFRGGSLTCACGVQILRSKKAGEPDILVTKPSTAPTPAPRVLTKVDAIDIDPESEAMIEVACVDCKSPMLLDPQVPEGVDPEAPRVPVCSDCAKARVRHAAMTEQRNVEVIKRTRVAKHQPRTTDHIDHPVTTTKKETNMDLDNMSDAELGALVRQQMKAALAEKIVAAKPAVEEQRIEHEAEQVAGVAEARKARVILPGFMVGTTLEIPDLDMSDVPSMDEAPDAKIRSPYNKARFRLTKEAPLDPEETTYAVLALEHERLREAAAAHNVEKAEPKAKKPKAEKVEQAPVQVQVAVMDADEKAVIKRKVKALMEVTGMSKKEAKAVVLSM